MIKEHIDSFMRKGLPAEVFEKLISVMERHKHIIVDRDKDKGMITIRYLTLTVNAIVWRCWSEKIMVKVGNGGHGKTKVDVYAIPNLFRIKVKRKEKEQNINELLGQLKEPF